MACSSQDLKFDEYDLCHQNKSLDLSLTMRFVNLSNNAQLELKKLSGPRPDGEVTVAVSTEGGDRKTGRFISSTCLYDVISQTTGLPKLKKGHQVVCIYMRKEVFGEENLRATTIRNLGLTSGNAVLRVTSREIDAQGQAHVENLKLKKPSGEESQMDQKVTQVKESVSKFGKSLKSMATGLFERKEAATTASKTTLSTTSTSSKSTDNSFSGQGRTLQPTIPSKSSSSPAAREHEVQDAEPNSEICWLSNERDALIFILDDMSKMTHASEELSDDFFEITRDDVMYMLQDLKRQVINMDNRPLETAALRERRRKETKYSKCVLRICFPGDGLVIQATFKPQETVAVVIEFLCQFLIDPNLGFYLYTTPPKQVLKPSDTLVEKKLVPAAMIHFGQASSISSPVLDPVLREKVTSFQTISETARRLREKVDNAVEDLDTPSSVNTSTSTLRQTQEPIQSSQVKKTDPSKVPKWFKMPK